MRFQRHQPTSGGNCCHLIPSNCFLYGFPDPSEFAAAKLTHYSTMPHRPSRPRQRLLLSGDVHQNTGPATKYPCSVCTSNVTSRGVIYMCNRCFGWVHSRCPGLQNAAEYRRIKNWPCSSCSSPPTPPTPQPLPSPITTKASDGDPFTILQFNANGEFLERQKVKVAVIQESELTLNSRTQNIQNFTTVRKYLYRGQGDGLLTLILNSINFSRRPDSPDTLEDPHLEELTITAKLGNTYFIITNVYIPPESSCTGGLSDDDDGHPHTGRLQCSPLIVVLKFYRFERHCVGDHGVWLLLRYSQLGFTNKIARQCQPKFPSCLICINLSYYFYQLADEGEPRLRPSTNPH